MGVEVKRAGDPAEAGSYLRNAALLRHFAMVTFEALETDCLAEAARFEPLHLEIRSAELHRANGSWAAGLRLRFFFESAARALAIRDAKVRVLPPGAAGFEPLPSRNQICRTSSRLNGF
jgi:hypothetical protein